MKKLFAILLILVMTVAIAACKRDEAEQTMDSTASNSTENSTEPITETTEPTGGDAGSVVEKNDGQENYYLENGTQYCTRLFDEAGKVTKRMAYRNGALLLNWEYRYDENGLLKSVYVYDAEDDDPDLLLYGSYTLTTEISAQGCTDTYYEDGALYKKMVYNQNWDLLGEYQYHDGEETWSEVYTYDQNGNMVREAYYYDKVPRYAVEYNEFGTFETHYENGQPVWRGHSYDGEDGWCLDAEFYNENGRVIQKVHYEGYRECWNCLYTYDENGVLIDQTLEHTQENETVVHRKHYFYYENKLRGYEAESGWDYVAEYDEQGRILWENTSCGHGEDGEYSNHIEYEYHADGGYTTVYVGGTCGQYYSHYDKNGNLLDYYGDDDPIENGEPSDMGTWNSYQYNEYGDMISYDEYCFGELLASYRYEYQYDVNGNWTEKNCYYAGELSDCYYRSYDEASRVIEEVSADGSNRCTYTYDENGNLTQKREEGPSGTDIYTYIYDELGRLSQEIWRYIEN